MAVTPTETAESSGSESRSKGLRRALDTLGVKLFLAIAGANLVLVMAVYLGYSFILDKGLVDYVSKTEVERLKPIVESLGRGYQDHGDWKWLEEDGYEAWWLLLREELGWRFYNFNINFNRELFNRDQRALQRDDRGRGARPQTGERPQTKEGRSESVENRGAVTPERAASDHARADQPAVTPPLTITRVLLFDAMDNPIIPGRIGAETLAQVAKLDIRVNGTVVGKLGYVPSLTQLRSVEVDAKRKQTQGFLVIALGMFAAVLLNATLISHWLSRRLRAVGHGATALARGDYATRIKATGNDELSRLAGDFNHLAFALEAAQRGRQQWIADIAHELRTPLTSLRAEVEAVQDGVRPLTQASIASVAQEVHQLTRLVEDLRLLSLSDLGALTCRKEPAQLSEIIDDALAIGRSSIAQRGLQLQVNVDESILVEADADRLGQVFSNLLQNTLRYTESPGRLDIRAVIDGANARIEWEDSAPGVTDADLHRLTERLYRADESRTRASGGTGLGLAIVKAIIDAHGGRMQAGHSALGGLRWSIWLPLSES